MKICFN